MACMSINGFQLFQNHITLQCGLFCIFFLGNTHLGIFLIPLKFIINNLSMFFQQNDGLGELLGNLERQISRPHWGSIESHAFCQYYTWQSDNYTMLQVC